MILPSLNSNILALGMDLLYGLLFAMKRHNVSKRLFKRIFYISKPYSVFENMVNSFFLIYSKSRAVSRRNVIHIVIFWMEPELSEHGSKVELLKEYVSGQKSELSQLLTLKTCINPNKWPSSCTKIEVLEMT